MLVAGLEGETMFNYHGYSGPCPKPPLLQPHKQRVGALINGLKK